MHASLSSYRALLIRYLRPQAAKVVVLAGLLLGSIALELVNPQIVRLFIDAATTHDTRTNLTVAAALFISLALLQQTLSVGATYVSERVGWTATNALRADLTLHCLRLDLSFHKARTPGELIERIDGDVTALANFFSQFIVQVLGSLVLLVGVLAVLWTVDWHTGAVLTVFAVAILAAMVWLRAVAVPYWTAERQANADLYGFLEERLGGTADLRSSGAEAYTMRRLVTYVRARLRAGSRARVVGTITWTVPVVGYALGQAAAFSLAFYLYRSHGITIGTAFVIYYYTGLLFQPLNLISNQIDDFQKAGAGIVRIQELLRIRSRLDDGPGATFPVGPLAVEFQDVAFGYGEEDMVVQGLTFALAPGQILGLLGRTGSGKTTIARLLFRLYDPASGSVRLNGVDLRQAHISAARGRVGMVTQDVQLFRATVRDNVTFFDSSIGDERILAALAELGLEEWRRALPNGLDTMLAPGGGGLSAGEAQLLAFARVFLKDPGVVILDEASSRLDPATERLIERAIGKLLQGRTAIIIAHRLATVARVDTVMIMDNGQVVEYGERERLARDAESRFAGLLRRGLEEVVVA